MMTAIEIGVHLMTLYAVCGIVFAAAFVWAGVQRIDPNARGSGIAFRMIILPGVAALWPLMLRRWIRCGASR
jgi:hypothetical protein